MCVAGARSGAGATRSAPVDGLLKRVAMERIQLVSSGGSDWLDGSGKAVKVDGGYRIYARKIFASGIAIRDLFMTGAIDEDAPEGPTMLAIRLPDDAAGALGQGYLGHDGHARHGSHDVLLDDVFVPDAAIGRAASQASGIRSCTSSPWWRFRWSMPSTRGVAEAARDLAVGGGQAARSRS